MKNKIKKNIIIAFLLIIGLIFVIKFGGGAILRMYVETGLGNCKKTPILCVKPQREVANPVINEKYLFDFPCSELTGIQICSPRGFKLIKQRITKVHYEEEKKGKIPDSAIYLLYERPDFFINLFRQAKKYGINNDYDFITRVMNVSLNEINDLTDTFFVIMKGIFTPDLGDQNNVRILKVTGSKFKGFISYSMGASENYFDCNIFDNQNNFFKLYIKDMAKSLNVDKVLAILSSINKVNKVN